jgi:predicted transposase YbfD/YdcC
MQKSQTHSPLKGSLLLLFDQLPDPRVEGRCKHRLLDVIVISVCALLCGAESWVEIAEFGRQRFEWFRRFLKLENGIPSHDTFARVFSLIRPEAFERLFVCWSRRVQNTLSPDSKVKKEHLCVDGKSISGTATHRGGSALHLVSIYNHSSGLVLGQKRASMAGHAESHAVLECLEWLDIQGAVVSADAGGATRRLVRKIREKKADYLVPAKGGLRKYLLGQLEEVRPAVLSQAIEEEHAHGRVEKRECKVYSSAKLSKIFKNNWSDVKSIVEITRTRTVVDFSLGEHEPTKTSTDTVFYISSSKLGARAFNTQIREHWGIENQLHWSLDVAFREDAWKVRDKKAARTLALVRKMAFNLLKASPSEGSVRTKMKRAAWNQNSLEEIMLSPGV